MVDVLEHRLDLEWAQLLPSERIRAACWGAASRAASFYAGTGLGSVWPRGPALGPVPSLAPGLAPIQQAPAARPRPPSAF